MLIVEGYNGKSSWIINYLEENNGEYLILSKLKLNYASNKNVYELNDDFNFSELENLNEYFNLKEFDTLVLYFNCDKKDLTEIKKYISKFKINLIVTVQNNDLKNLKIYNY